MPSLEFFETSTSLKFNLLGSFSKDERPENWDIDGYKTKIAKLSDYDVVDCAFLAAMWGNVELLRLLYQEKKDIKVVYENLATNPDRHVLNGVTYRTEFFDRLKDLKSLAHFKDLLKAIDEFGIKGLSEPGLTPPALFHRIDYNSVVSKLPVERFSGELPFLSEGLLNSPELAIALKHEESTHPHSAAYKPIFCWASPEMVEQFPESLIELKPVQQIGTFDALQSMADFKAGGEAVTFKNRVVVGLLRPEAAVNAPMLMESLCPLGSRYGFDDLHGRILCETTTDFLLGFDAAGVSSRNTQAAKDFARNYFPLKIIATNVCEKTISEYGYRSNQPSFKKNSCQEEFNRQDAYNDLFALLSKDHPLEAQAKGILTPDQWSSMLSAADGDRLSPISLIAMNQAFGIDNTGLKISVAAKEVSQYLEGGYKFNSDSIFCQSSKKAREIESQSVESVTSVQARFDVYGLWTARNNGRPQKPNLDQVTEDFLDVVIGINLWPSDLERPKDLVEALSMAGPRDLTNFGSMDAMALRAVLVDAGLEACVAVASTPRSWLKIAEAFSRDALTPYLAQMPRAARGKLLEQDLGM